MKQVSEAGGAIAHLPPQKRDSALLACAAAGKPRMRILMVAARYHPYMGGVETHTHEVARQLVARGQSVTVLSTDPSGRHAAEESLDGIEVLRVRPWSKKDDYYFAPAIAGKIASGAWDIVHVQGYHTFVAPLAMAAAVRRGIPFVITFHSGGHSSRLRNSLRRIQHGLLRPLIRRADQIIAVSDFEANFFSSRLHIPRERFAVIQNGARLPEPSPGCSRESALLIVSIGRLERYKGHHRAILAFAELAQRMPKAHLRILGEGPYEKPLRQLVRALELEERVTIGGVPPHDRQGLADVLGSARLVVLLSEYEAHPVAVVEALALGCNVLVSDTSGLREIADKGLCRCVPLHASSCAVAKAMASELFSPPKVPAAPLPDWNSCADQLLCVYERVLVGR
jgi:glycosyltransferase involved in cell wall biosynthesis